MRVFRKVPSEIFFFGQKQLRGSMANDPEDLAWGLEQVLTW